jgi:hypothetical protein
MPHIVFHGLRSGSEDFEADNIEKIETAILQGITEIQELELDSKGVSFSFVHDPTLISEAAPIIVFVEGGLVMPTPQPDYRGSTATGQRHSRRHRLYRQRMANRDQGRSLRQALQPRQGWLQLLPVTR